MQSQVQRLYDSLQRSTVDPNRYKAALQDVVFELMEADTFVAGIASSFLEGEQVDRSHLAILGMTFLVDTSWLRRDGSRFDLQSYPELLDYARCVEALKHECARLLLPKSPH